MGTKIKFVIILVPRKSPTDVLSIFHLCDRLALLRNCVSYYLKTRKASLPALFFFENCGLRRFHKKLNRCFSPRDIS